jgi:hypothetical protein
MFCLFGLNSEPQGWVSVENNPLKIFGLKDVYEISSQKEIILKNDKITLTNLYDESSYIFQLRLNPGVASDLKKFLEKKLAMHGTRVVNAVKSEA